MNNDTSAEGSFFMQHPGTGDMIPLTRSSVSTIPLARFLKEAFYKLPCGTYTKAHRVGASTDHALRDKYFDDLQNLLV